jgi:predicted ribosome quality control (RQC) complex YloA/Tae2 family protein
MKAKVSSAKKKQAPERNGQEWQQLYEKMRKERNRLRKELAEVKKECDVYRRSLGALMAKLDPIEFDEEEVLAQMRRGGGQSFAELIAEVEAEFGR